jgi:hypothetical protein
MQGMEKSRKSNATWQFTEFTPGAYGQCNRIWILKFLEAMIGNFDKEIDELLMQRHREVAFKALCNRIEEDNFHSRMMRCVRYSDRFMQFEVERIFKANQKHSPIASLIKHMRRLISRI